MNQGVRGPGGVAEVYGVVGVGNFVAKGQKVTHGSHPVFGIRCDMKHYGCGGNDGAKV